MSITLQLGVSMNTGGVVSTPVPYAINTLTQATGGIDAVHVTTTGNVTRAVAANSIIIALNPIGATGNLTLQDSANNPLFRVAPGDFTITRATGTNFYYSGAIGVNATIFILTP